MGSHCIMKTYILLATMLSTATATLVKSYVRDLMTETTSRAFEKDPITGLHRCEPGFTGSDCSQLKCPFSMSFATSTFETDWLFTPSTASFTPTVHFPAKSSGNQQQVTKDTTFDNQHGQCRTDANSFYFLGQTPAVKYGNSIPDYSKVAGSATWGIHWPWLKYQQCHCDAGYEGDDCSLRTCPKGDDPETECENDLGNDVQWLDCTFAKSGSANLTSAFFYIRFTDQFNGEYDTRPIKIDVTTSTGLTAEENANSIQDALEALPNFAIPEIEVDFTVTALAGHSGSPDRPQIRLEFTDGHNTGKQPLVQVFSVADCAAGSQPYFESVVAGGDLTCEVTRATATAKEYKESDTCSNRGICDQSTGLCNCFDGYFGLACDNVNTYI